MAPTSRSSARRKSGPPAALLHSADKVEDHLRRRSTILRSLGQSTYRNGSQFAIFWVSPAGDQTEVYASEGLCKQLPKWFGREQQVEATEAVQQLKRDREIRIRQGRPLHEGDQVFGPHGEVVDLQLPGEEDEGESLDVPSDLPSGRPPGGMNYDEFLPTPTRAGTSKLGSKPLLPSSSASSSSAEASSSRITRSHSAAHLPPPASHPSPAALSPSSAPSPAAATALSPFAAPSPACLSAPLPARAPTPHVPWVFTPNTLPGWYETRFTDVGHKTDKHLAKVWIKAVEPHKQTKHPYHRGEESKPEWWPREVKHKEPDHLGKGERKALLTHLARFAPVSVETLDTAINMLPVSMPPEKVAVAREILRVAKEERKAMERCGNGTFDQFTVALGPLVPEVPKQEDDEENRPHNTRHRTRRSIGNADSLAPSSQQQQTPRPSVRAAPYPLSRSHSVSEVAASHGSPVRSPAYGSSSAAASSSSGMTRSRSLAGPITSSGKPRGVRQNGRHSLGEADLSDPNNGAFVPSSAGGGGVGAEFQQSLQTTPYSSAKMGGRPNVTPRQGQGSPLTAGMSRSYSTSALGGAAMIGSGKKAAPLIDDSVASPAMIKSRSRLSQQHFDQMGLGNLKAGGGGNGRPQPQLPQPPPPQSHPSHPPRHQQPQFHQHLDHFERHLAQPPPRPPLQHSHTQPIPLAHHVPQQQHHLVQHQQQPPPGHVLVYPSQPLSRQNSAHGVPLHPAHQLQLQQGGGHHHIPHPHHSGPHVQVQVQVSASHSLPPDFEQQQQHQQQQLANAQAQAHFHALNQQATQQHQQPQRQYGAYPTPSTATFASPNPNSPYLSQDLNSGFHEQQPHLPSHVQHHPQQQQPPNEAYLVPHSQHLDPSLYSSSGAPDAMGEYLLPSAHRGDGASTPGSATVATGAQQNGFYGSPHLGGPSPASTAGTPNLSGLGGGGAADDLSAYVQQLEQCEMQHFGGASQPARGAVGFEQDPSAALGLGAGMGLGLEPGYYGDDGFGVVGA
ncbi:hypothetical protein JCM8547_002179 [Rhodosporidiobolus lusitaniae]